MIYLDNAATTQPTEEVINDIMNCLKENWANPSSPYQEGRTVRSIVENARKQIADSINASPEEIIFTSGGSEANNLAIKGFCNMYYVPCLFTTEIEHSSVYNTCKSIDFYRRGKLKYIPLDSEGKIRLDLFEKMFDNEYTKGSLISVMYANNEIGTIQPIKEIARIVKEHECFIHVDAVQAFPHCKIDVKNLGIDMMSVSGHKFGCPKGIGFLYVKNGINLTPLIHGGDQEFSLRGGTENVPYIYAMGNQVKRINTEPQLIGMFLHSRIVSAFDTKYKITLNGSQDDNRIWDILSLTFHGFDAQALITLLNDRSVCVSAGSACNAGAKSPSRVLKAIGLSDEDALSTLRISVGTNTTIGDCIEFVQKLESCLNILSITN